VNALGRAIGAALFYLERWSRVSSIVRRAGRHASYGHETGDLWRGIEEGFTKREVLYHGRPVFGEAADRFSRVLRANVVTAAPRCNASFISAARSLFKKWQVELRPKEDNPHSVDAEIRRNATMLMERIVQAAGLERFDVQTCNGQLGSSAVFDPVDVLVEPSAATEGGVHRFAYTMVDVDYYINMHEFLSEMKPVCLYTMVPDRAAGDDGTSTYYFSNNEMTFTAHGGYVATHAVWDYGPDYMNTTWRGVTTHYRVLKYAYERSRSLVVLVPQFTIPERLQWAHAHVTRHTLSRFNFNHPGTKGEDWTAFKYFDASGCHVTVAAAGPDSKCVTVPWNVFSEVVDTLRVLGGDRVPEHTVSQLTNSKHAYLLCGYARQYLDKKHKLSVLHRGLDKTSPVVVGAPGACPCQNCVDPVVRGPNVSSHYKVGAHESVAEKTTVTAAASSPYVDKVGAATNAAAPIRDKEAAKQAVQERVEKPQQESRRRMDPERIRPFIRPFVAALLLRLPKVDPVTDEEVLRRVKPAARQVTAEGLRERLTKNSKQTKAFIKAETYPEMKAPRLITPLSPELQSRMYRYSYALQDALHGQQWFAFGRTLPSLAQCIAEITRGQPAVLETDFSKYDGTISSLAREVEREVYYAFFPRHRSELKVLGETQVNQLVSVKGVKYSSGTSRSSGAPDTCLMNSILNLFTLYVYMGEAAFEQAVVGGDDGLIVLPSTKCYTSQGGKLDCPMLRQIAEAMGFSIKCTVRESGQSFSFLARRFMFGGCDSICQPDRTMSKAHIIGHPNVPPKLVKARLAMKLVSLLGSDANTPVVGDKLRSMLKDTGFSEKDDFSKLKMPAELLASDGWWGKILESGPWPNTAQPWMLDEVTRFLKKNGTLVEASSSK
jgi:hypothetical protein